jgi:hypothetical protein
MTIAASPNVARRSVKKYAWHLHHHQVAGENLIGPHDSHVQLSKWVGTPRRIAMCPV